MQEFSKHGSVIVSWDFTLGIDKGILLIARQEPEKPVKIINAFQGKEAEEVMRKLTIRNLGKGPVV